MNRSQLIGRIVVLTGLLSGAAFAQSPAPSPEDEWGGIKPPPAATQESPPPIPPSVGPPPPAPPAPPVTVAPMPAPPSGMLRARPDVLARIRPVEERNQISMLGAPSLGAGKRAQMVLLGFPILTIRALFGISDRIDLGLGFDTYYFLMNEPRAILRVGLVRGENWSLAASLEGGYAFFAQRASRESRGARWLTGRRNINTSAAVALAYQGSKPRDARVFFEGRYTLALDTEPYATDPLVGVPPAIVPGHNVSIKGGAELPLSSKTSFVFSFGFDIHGRAEDSVVMPGGSLGLVTSL
jgi:hypothetical protein